MSPLEGVLSGWDYYQPALWAVNHTPQIANGAAPTTCNPKVDCTWARATPTSPAPYGN